MSVGGVLGFENYSTRFTVVVYFSDPPRTFIPPTKLLQQKDFLRVPRQLSSVKVRGVLTKVHNHGKYRIRKMHLEE